MKTKTCKITNSAGDEFEVTLELRSHAPAGTYNSAALQLAKRHGLPDISPFKYDWQPTIWNADKCIAATVNHEGEI